MLASSIKKRKENDFRLHRLRHSKVQREKKSHFYYILKYCDEQQGNVQALSGIP
jgi:hypothetical protein